ncbi:MAG: hypothetical protein WCA49_07565 [Candidatus Sulfotelmatobacter sp.]
MRTDNNFAHVAATTVPHRRNNAGPDQVALGNGLTILLLEGLRRVGWKRRFEDEQNKDREQT